MSISELNADQLYHPSSPDFLPCEKEPLEGEQLCALVDQLANPVLLVR
jgi:hypothetical protein